MKSRTKKELIDIIAVAVPVYLLSAHFDILEKIVEFAGALESWNIDEILVVSIYLVIAFLFFALRRLRESEEVKRELKQEKERMADAQGELRMLKQIIPICAWCKEIRDDDGYWHQLESYMQEHGGLSFSHGMCPKCMDKWRKDADAAHPTHEQETRPPPGSYG